MYEIFRRSILTHNLALYAHRLVLLTYFIIKIFIAIHRILPSMILYDAFFPWLFSRMDVVRNLAWKGFFWLLFWWWWWCVVLFRLWIIWDGLYISNNVIKYNARYLKLLPRNTYKHTLTHFHRIEPAKYIYIFAKQHDNDILDVIKYIIDIKEVFVSFIHFICIFISREKCMRWYFLGGRKCSTFNTNIFSYLFCSCKCKCNSWISWRKKTR